MHDEGSPRLVLMDFFPVEQMQALQDLFAQTHQLSVVITDLDGNWITSPSNFSALCLIMQGAEKVKERCELTYKVVGETLRDTGSPTWQECVNCGFVEGGVPIQVAGQHVANCLVGQNNALKVSRQRIEEYAWLMEVDVLQVRNAYPAMPSLPMDVFTKILHLYAVYISQVTEQAYRMHQLNAEVDRLRKVETGLRQEGVDLIQTSTVLRESINHMGRDLQAVLRSVNDLTDEHDHVKLPGPQAQVETMLIEVIEKIRRAYRTVLDGMALEHAQRSEMETLLFGNQPGLHRRRLVRRRVDYPRPESNEKREVEKDL